MFDQITAPLIGRDRLTLSSDGLAMVGGTADRLVLARCGCSPRDGNFVVRWVP